MYIIRECSWELNKDVFIILRMFREGEFERGEFVEGFVV